MRPIGRKSNSLPDERNHCSLVLQSTRHVFLVLRLKKRVPLMSHAHLLTVEPLINKSDHLTDFAFSHISSLLCFYPSIRSGVVRVLSSFIDYQTGCWFSRSSFHSTAFMLLMQSTMVSAELRKWVKHTLSLALPVAHLSPFRFKVGIVGIISPAISMKN